MPRRRQAEHKTARYAPSGILPPTMRARVEQPGARHNGNRRQRREASRRKAGGEIMGAEILAALHSPHRAAEALFHLAAAAEAYLTRSGDDPVPVATQRRELAEALHEAWNVLRPTGGGRG